MDASRDDLIQTIVEALMAARYAPPKRRRAAWHEGYDEDLQQARRVAAAIADALQVSGDMENWTRGWSAPLGVDRIRLRI
jgi:hypothetical protein